jgi:hypothetical protein
LKKVIFREEGKIGNDHSGEPFKREAKYPFCLLGKFQTYTVLTCFVGEPAEGLFILNKKIINFNPELDSSSLVDRKKKKKMVLRFWVLSCETCLHKEPKFFNNIENFVFIITKK